MSKKIGLHDSNEQKESVSPAVNAIDELDRKILEEYVKNSHSSSREIAKKIGVAVSTILSRTRKLEQKGIIKNYTLMLDHEKLGYKLTAVTEVRVSKGKLIEVETEIAKMPETCAVYDVTGEIDAIIVAKFKDRQELSEYAKILLAIPHVARTNTHVVLATLKEDFRLI